jgi:hypothetical protein
MKNILAGAAIAVALLAPLPGFAADYATIVLEKAVNRTPAQTWAKIGGYCTIQDWLKAPCVITAGDGKSVGTIRRLRDTTDEVMVAQTPYSYTYTQPATTILYHGTLAVEPADGGAHSKIVYTLFYDAAPLETADKKAADRAARSKRFGDALDAMKAMAEAQ